MTSAAHIDLYQLTSLIPHYDAGRSKERVVMCFFSRRLPKNAHTGEPARGYLLFAGLQRCLDHLEHARFTDQDIDGLRAHPVLGPALTERPELATALRNWRFSGTVWAPKEGTPVFAGPAMRNDGTRLSSNGVSPAAYCPYLVVETDVLSAKLIETPLLSTINHMTMVASKASRVVRAATAAGEGRRVLEFGQRRTHPMAAVDAALAAYIAGCASTSNVAAHLQHGVPMAGTMDHFAIQACEQPGVPRHESEFSYFHEFHKAYPGRDILLVDTYDTFGERCGIRNAVAAAPGGPSGIRLDSDITADNVRKARALLDELGATDTLIFVSGGMDEHAIAELGDAPVDGYGIGERIVTSPDAPVGVGAVGKISMVSGRPSMKLSRGSGKATLPGQLQVWRDNGQDLVGLAHEEHSGEKLLDVVWQGTKRLPPPSYEQVREYSLAALAALPANKIEPRQEGVVVSDALAELVVQLVAEAS